MIIYKYTSNIILSYWKYTIIHVMLVIIRMISVLQICGNRQGNTIHLFKCKSARNKKHGDITCIFPFFYSKVFSHSNNILIFIYPSILWSSSSYSWLVGYVVNLLFLSLSSYFTPLLFCSVSFSLLCISSVFQLFVRLENK